MFPANEVERCASIHIRETATTKWRWSGASKLSCARR